MPLIINPDLQIIDGGESPGRVVRGPGNDTSQVSEADINTAVAQAGEDLGVDPVTLAYEAGNTGASVRLNKFTPEELAAYQKGRADKVTSSRVTTQAGLNPDNPMPEEDPGEGMYWANYGGVWRKYQYVTNTNTGNNGNNGNNGNGNNGNGNTDANGNPIVTDTTGKPTTNIDVLKAALRGLGFTSAIIDQSTAFLNGLIRDGLDVDNATEVFLNSKEYTLKNGTKMTSPFYTEYGYLNEGLTVPKDASTLFNTVEGFKGVVDKYKLSTKYLTQDSLKSYFKNDVTVADLSERAATAQLRAVEADQFQVNALVKLGYIGSAADLTDFYLDAKIGKEQLELNRQTGVFTAEALRRAKSGISTSADQLKGFKQLTATLAAKGYSEAQISQLAGTGFENISETLQPTTAFAQMFEKAGGTVESNAALTEDVQTSLLAEEFSGTASQRRKKLFEQNQRSFQGQAGTTSGSLRTSSVAGIL